MMHLCFHKLHHINTNEFSNVLFNIRKDLVDLQELDKSINLTKFKDDMAIAFGCFFNQKINNYSHFIEFINKCKNSDEFKIFRLNENEKNSSNGGFLLSIIYFFLNNNYNINSRTAKKIIDRHIGRTQKKSIHIVYKNISYSENESPDFIKAYNPKEKDLVIMCLAKSKSDSLTIYNTTIINDESSTITFVSTQDEKIKDIIPGHLVPGASFNIISNDEGFRSQLLFPNEAIYYQLERLKNKSIKNILMDLYHSAHIDRNFRMRVYLDEMVSDLYLNHDFAIKNENIHIFEHININSVIYGPGDEVYSTLFKKHNGISNKKAETVKDLIDIYNKIVMDCQKYNAGEKFQLNLISHGCDYLEKIFKNNFYSLQDVICSTQESYHLDGIATIINIKDIHKYISKDFQLQYCKENKIGLVQTSA